MAMERNVSYVPCLLSFVIYHVLFLSLFIKVNFIELKVIMLTGQNISVIALYEKNQVDEQNGMSKHRCGGKAVIRLTPLLL